MLIVSPHLDVAVLSVGQLMAGRPDTVVLTAFAGTPPRATMVKTSFDQNSGFPHAFRAIGERRREDRAALALLGATPIHAEHLDRQYRGDDPEARAATVKRLTESIVDEIDDLRVDIVLGPLGLAHDDHLVTAEAFSEALRARPNVAGWVYEELPARVLWPELAQRALEDWNLGQPWSVNGTEPGFLGTGPREIKEQAIRCYASQLWALDWPTLLVPERVWKVTE